MQSNFNKNIDFQKERKSWFRQLRFLLPLITVIVIALYIVAIRPQLMDTMSTVAIELAFAGIIFLALAINLVIIVVTLLITLLVAIFKRKKSKVIPWLMKLRSQTVVAITILLVLAIVTVTSQWLAYTPPILDENGEPVEGSIATLEKVKLGDSEQWISIRGNDTDKPILLFLAGGPGGTQIAATRTHLKELEKHFIVVNWEQPGSGKSYSSIPIESITPKTYISDTHELTLYLKERFNKEKIYLMGESWGSALGILVAERYPELYNGVIGTGQMISFIETERLDYNKAIEIAKERGDTSTIEKLEHQGPPPYYGDDVVWKESAYLMYLSSYMAKNPEIHGPGLNTLGDVAAPEYGLYDKVNFFRGVIYTFNHVYQQLYDIDLREQATDVDVPVYLLVGRHDINAPTVLAEDYFEKLNAPDKKFIWFEHSGHSPWIDEQDKFIDTVINLFVEKN